MGTACAEEVYETNCLDQCFKIHCSDEARNGRACGDDKAFQDCATCCESNFNIASGCFRRRRRLGAAMEAVATNRTRAPTRTTTVPKPASTHRAASRTV